MPSRRILVVDDVKAWRQTVCKMLEAEPEWRVVGEAADGFEAIHKAETLRPDIVLLDIGLGKLNGIEAAARISEVSPASRIVFLSQDNDRDIVQAALDTGGSAFVCKSCAGTELLPCVASVLQGNSDTNRNPADCESGATKSSLEASVPT